MHYFTIWH